MISWSIRLEVWILRAWCVLLYELKINILSLDKSWEDRWVQSTKKGAEAGKFLLTAGKFYGDAEKDKGL